VIVARSPLQREVEAAVWPEKALEFEHAAKRTGLYFLIFFHCQTWSQRV